MVMASSDKLVATCRSKHIVVKSSCGGSVKLAMKFSPNRKTPVDLLGTILIVLLQVYYIL